MPDPIEQAAGLALLHPRELLTAETVCRRPSPIPRVAGVYAWYFDAALPGVPTDGCHISDGWPLLYVGISPKAPPAGGGPGSQQTIQRRIRYHFRGNAYGSTLRLTLGSLLADDLGLSLRRVGSGKRMTFGRDGESMLSEWMATYARVAWAAVPAPWEVEKALIHRLVLPLNLDQNKHSAFYATLSAARARQRNAARAMPIIPG